MLFSIQVSNPQVIKTDVEQDDVEDLNGVLQRIVPMDTEDAILSWNHVPIRLNYKYDISVISEEIIVLLATLLDTDETKFKILWPSDTFYAEWRFRCEGDEIAIDATWHSISGGYESILNERDSLRIGRQDFLAEWKGLACQILRLLDEAGFDSERIAQVADLQRLEANVPNTGILYRD